MNFPFDFFAGDSLTWRDSATRDAMGNRITSTDWTLKYDIRGEVNLSLTAVADGESWMTTMTAAQSATLTAGVYYWQAYVTKGVDRITLGSGQVKVKPNLAKQAPGFDGRSSAQKDLDAVSTEITARLNGGASIEYTIGNRSLKKEPLSSLIALQSRLKTIVARERQAEMIANGVGNPRALYVRF